MLDDDLVPAGQEIVARQPPLGSAGASVPPLPGASPSLGSVGPAHVTNDNASHSCVKGPWTDVHRLRDIITDLQD